MALCQDEQYGRGKPHLLQETEAAKQPLPALMRPGTPVPPGAPNRDATVGSSRVRAAPAPRDPPGRPRRDPLSSPQPPRRCRRPAEGGELSARLCRLEGERGKKKRKTVPSKAPPVLTSRGRSGRGGGRLSDCRRCRPRRGWNGSRPPRDGDTRTAPPRDGHGHARPAPGRTRTRTPTPPPPPGAAPTPLRAAPGASARPCRPQFSDYLRSYSKGACLHRYGIYCLFPRPPLQFKSTCIDYRI